MIPLKSQLASAEAVYGVFCSTPTTLSVELIAAAGYDFIIIDLEHTLIGPEELRSMLVAARAVGLAPLVRTAARHQMVQVLDSGAEGVVVPRVRCVRDAEAAVRRAHFAPLGSRGLNATWRSRYGRDDLPGAMAKESEQTLVVAMIEDLDGLQNAAAIAAVPGIDVLLEGAADLSQSLGVPWQLRHADVQQRIADIASAAADAGKQFGALPRNPVDIATWKARGVTLFVLGDDRGITRRALSSHLQTYRSTGMAG